MADEAPILARKHHDKPSVFTPEGLLREARRQKGLPAAAVPQVSVLDPGGDIVRRPVRRDPNWACYHTDLYRCAREMEAAALYAFASARRKPVLCFAHVTNQIAQVHGDFEKGAADGTTDALAVIVAAAKAWLRAYNGSSPDQAIATACSE
jgi:hypothetical protein